MKQKHSHGAHYARLTLYGKNRENTELDEFSLRAHVIRMISLVHQYKVLQLNT